MKEAISKTVDYWLELREHPERFCQVTLKRKNVCEHCQEYEKALKQGERYQKTGDLKSFTRRI